LIWQKEAYYYSEIISEEFSQDFVCFFKQVSLVFCSGKKE